MVPPILTTADATQRLEELTYSQRLLTYSAAHNTLIHPIIPSALPYLLRLLPTPILECAHSALGPFTIPH